MTTARPIIFLVGSPDAHVSAQQTWNNLYRCHQLGPELFRWVYPMPLYGPNRLGIMSTDDIGWAQSFLAGAPDAPAWAQQTWNNFYRCHQLGPASFWWVSPMLLHGPSRLGIISTDDISRAQNVFQRVPPMLLYGPSRLGIIFTDDICWAQSFFGGFPRCSCMGPADLE